jgi:hypothetical protein
MPKNIFEDPQKIEVQDTYIIEPQKPHPSPEDDEESSNIRGENIEEALREEELRTEESRKKLLEKIRKRRFSPQPRQQPQQSPQPSQQPQQSPQPRQQPQSLQPRQQPQQSPQPRQQPPSLQPRQRPQQSPQPSQQPPSPQPQQSPQPHPLQQHTQEPDPQSDLIYKRKKNLLSKIWSKIKAIGSFLIKCIDSDDEPPQRTETPNPQKLPSLRKKPNNESPTFTELDRTLRHDPLKAEKLVRNTNTSNLVVVKGATGKKIMDTSGVHYSPEQLKLIEKYKKAERKGSRWWIR